MTLDVSGTVVAELGGDRIVIRGRGTHFELDLDVPRRRVVSRLLVLGRLGRRLTPAASSPWRGPEIAVFVRGRFVGRLGRAGWRTRWGGFLASFVLPRVVETNETDPGPRQSGARND